MRSGKDQIKNKLPVGNEFNKKYNPIQDFLYVCFDLEKTTNVQNELGISNKQIRSNFVEDIFILHISSWETYVIDTLSLMACL